MLIRRTVAPSTLLPVLLLSAVFGGCAPAATDEFPELTGAYLGQAPPRDSAELFAPGIVSTGMFTRDIAITPDGSEIYFGVQLGRFNTILETHRVNDRWTKPEVAPFARDARFFNLEPAISPDGQKFFFTSTRLPAGREPTRDEIRSWTNQDIWVMDRVGDHWSEPHNLGPPVNSDGPEFFPSVTRDGTLYFTRDFDATRESYLYRARLVDGLYQEPEKLGPQVNSTSSQFNAYVAPDESYLILCTGGRADSRGRTDYYVVFRNEDDTWSEPVNLGDAVNTPADAEYSPYVTRDGKYFFFMSSRPLPDAAIPDTLTRDFLLRFRAGPGSGNSAIYWMDAGFIERLRPAGDQPQR
jgi:WD40-like Beta Propeller Repeat